MNVLSAAFFYQDHLSLAKSLLGKILVHEHYGKLLRGMIVETEAYHQSDPASHSFSGITKRNAVMFGKPAHAYVYFTYGMHYCLNVVAMEEGIGAAVLIRALEPLEGLETMMKRRKTDRTANLCNGPAKLTQAFGISKAQNSLNLLSPPLYITQGRHVELKSEIVSAPRVGIKKAVDVPWRFYLKDSSYISKK